jgi:hypothetical protein
MDPVGCSCDHRGVVWLRMLLVLSLALFVTGIANAQAPPSSFFEHRSNDELRALALNPHNDVLLRRTAASKLVLILADAGDFDAADAAAREFATNIDARAVRHIGAVRRRSYVNVASLLALGVVFAGLSVSLVAARRSVTGALPAVRRLAPVFAFFLVNLAVVGGYFASGYENGSPLPFVILAMAMLPLVVMFRVWSAVGSPHVAARVGRASAAVAATVAIGFLIVEHINPSYLAGFGL